MNEFPHMQPKGSGWIEVVVGCMFSGKTEELIRRLRRAKIAKQKVIVFKPVIDNRYSADSVVSHSELSIESVNINNITEVYERVGDAQVVGIDEAQFFSNDLIKVCTDLANSGKRVVVAGLDQDYRGVPFEPMPELMAIAEFVTKTLAICVVCGNPASRTQRTIASGDRVLVGAADSYEARCRKCHYIPGEGEDPALF
ncbi:MAG: thymidine kinase [Ignavibacteriales bacterium UTCHB3]|nr:MAG: thymidine kinase [Ignavibacteriales bacterium UTCHB3]